MTHHARLCIPVLALLCACSILEPREDPTRFFVLSPAAESGAAPGADPALLIALGPIHVPDYLLRPELVRRAGPNQLEPSRIDRWAEPVDRALVRVLCLDLGALMPQSSVVPFPAASGEKPGLEIEIDVSAFEADAKGTARLHARWHVRDAEPRAVRECKLERAAQSGETPEVVAAMSALLADLAASIAAEVGGGGSPAAR